MRKELVLGLVRAVAFFATGFCLCGAWKGYHPAILWPLAILMGLVSIGLMAQGWVQDYRQTVRTAQEKERDRLAEARGRAFITNMRNEAINAQRDRALLRRGRMF